MSARAFGIAALRDPDFVAALCRGRSPRLSTVDRALVFMGAAPAGPALRAEVEEFLAVTGIKRSALGLGATGNPSFVAQLRRGASPTLKTVGRLWAWMVAHTSAAERREIERRTGAMPAVLSGIPPVVSAPLLECPARPEPEDHGPEQPTGGRNSPAYVSTVEAAARLGLSPRTLDRYRTTGRGPAFYRFGGRVRYSGEDLDAWAAARRTGRTRVPSDALRP